MTLTFGSLFSGIGGIDLGLERVGMRCVWQVEINAYCQKVLAKHWPRLVVFGDIRECGKNNLSPVDVLCGGFPCQDISHVGKKAGIDGSRSGLWREFNRIICELRPRFVIVENVAALRSRGLDRVLGDLAASGYDAEWQVLPSAAFGAPHLRERVFIVAYPHSNRLETVFQRCGILQEAYSHRLLDASRSSSSNRRANSQRLLWPPEPAICRVVDGLPKRVDRLRSLGNAVVPQVAEFVGRCILDSL